MQIQDQRILKGTRNWEPVPGEPAQKGVFWASVSPNLLYSAPDSAEERPNTSVDVAAGTHTFPFSINLPSTYAKAKPQSVFSWTKGIFGGSANQQTREVEDLPLPSTTLGSQMHDYSTPHLYQYTIWVSIETGPGHDDYKLSC